MHTYHGIVHLTNLISKKKKKKKRLVASGKEFCEEEKENNNNTGAPPHLDTVSELRFGSGEDLLS
jgi:hypothetical protein